MNGAIARTRAETSPTDREVESELRLLKAIADREAEEAREEFNRKRAVRSELDRSGRLVSDVDASGRTLRPLNQPRGMRLLQEELEVARQEAASAVVEAAQRLRTARARQRQAGAALAAYQLQHGLLAAHERACEQVAAATARAEEAQVALIVALIERAEACSEEGARARAVVAAALTPLTGEEERAQVRDRAADEVPTEVDEDGNVVAWRSRPVAGLHGLAGQDWHPKHDSFFEAMADVIRGGRSRVRANVGSERVALAIEKKLSESA
jgi:hypothetical protein